MLRVEFCSELCNFSYIPFKSCLKLVKWIIMFHNYLWFHPIKILKTWYFCKLPKSDSNPLIREFGIVLEFSWNNFKKFVFSPYKQGNVRLSRHIRWQSRTMCNHFLLQELQNYNLLLNNCRQENVGSHQKKTTHIQGQRRSPSKMVGGAKSCLESNSIPARDTLRAQTYLVCTEPRDLHQNLHRTGETDSWRAQAKPGAHQDPGERSHDPTRDWPRLARECPGVSGGAWVVLACCRVGGTECSSACTGPFEGDLHYLHYLHHSSASVQTTGGNTAPAINRKLD